jgi:hypothetical protein
MSQGTTACNWFPILWAAKFQSVAVLPVPQVVENGSLVRSAAITFQRFL